MKPSNPQSSSHRRYLEFVEDYRHRRLDARAEEPGPGQEGKKPEPGKPFLLDLNRAYNPPCAFSEFTTCPLPPKQNILPVRVEAGEKYPPLKKSG